jgi:DNA-binding NarL/FixJ family response regulator
MKTLRILVVDDHDVVREGVRKLLSREANLEICGEAKSGLDAIRKASELKPDVAVVDLRMPDMSGIEVTQRIREISSETEVVILTMYELDEFVQKSLHAGARAYVLKSHTGRDLAEAIKAASQQGRFISPEVSRSNRPT